MIWRRWAGRHPTGIDRVCLAYLDRFGDRAQAVVQHRYARRVLDVPASRALFALLAEPGERFRPDLVRGIVRHAARGGDSGKGRLYLNIGHTGLDDEGFQSWVGHAGVRPVYLVHDLIPITHPEFCRPGERRKHEHRMRTILSTAAGVIGNSQATVDSLASFGASQSLPRPPAIAAWLGLPTRPAAQTFTSVETPTFVTLGTIEARKNHLMLLLVWRRLVERLGARAPRLLVIGQRGWEAEQAIDLLERSAILKDHVAEIGRCSDEALAAHLATARALLFPSLAEGFGLPLIEALGSGTPVIASDLPVFREIGGSVPDYIDPLDGPAWERAIMAYADENSADRKRQLARLTDYRAPTWDDHFESVEPWLSTL